ncbi:type I methionyl aminopeptidase [candidate division KSB1 bacterium]|nr:type I methionyl aminopeptidase [candidate division KSB1 bacterium]
MIIIKSQREVDLIRKSSRIIAECFDLVKPYIKPGVKTKELDDVVLDHIQSRGGISAFKNYNGYPGNICVSIDKEVVHGIPGERTLEEGQIVSIDIGVILNNYYGDAARTFAVGAITDDKKKLLRVTEEALLKGIDEARVGNRLSDISNAIQTHVERENFSVVRDLVGHGVGRKLHEDPQIPNYGEPNRGPRLKPGMVFAIEPMVNMGSFQVVVADDSWTIYTKDGMPSAHFEHTIAITAGDPEILSVIG